jgi:hypothetical protein
MWDLTRSAVCAWSVAINTDYSASMSLADCTLAPAEWLVPRHAHQRLRAFYMQPDERPFYYVCRQNYLAIRQGRAVPFEVSRAGGGDTAYPGVPRLCRGGRDPAAHRGQSGMPTYTGPLTRNLRITI